GVQSDLDLLLDLVVAGLTQVRLVAGPETFGVGATTDRAGQVDDGPVVGDIDTTTCVDVDAPLLLEDAYTQTRGRAGDVEQLGEFFFAGEPLPRPVVAPVDGLAQTIGDHGLLRRAHACVSPGGRH